MYWIKCKGLKFVVYSSLSLNSYGDSDYRLVEINNEEAFYRVAIKDLHSEKGYPTVLHISL